MESDKLPATEKQVRMIYALAKKLDYELESKPSEMSKVDAMVLIDELKSKIGSENGFYKDNSEGARLGLAVKLTALRWIEVHKKPTDNPEDFKEEVKSLHQIISGIEVGAG